MFNLNNDSPFDPNFFNSELPDGNLFTNNPFLAAQQPKQKQCKIDDDIKFIDEHIDLIELDDSHSRQEAEKIRHNIRMGITIISSSYGPDKAERFTHIVKSLFHLTNIERNKETKQALKSSILTHLMSFRKILEDIRIDTNGIGTVEELMALVDKKDKLTITDKLAVRLLAPAQFLAMTAVSSIEELNLQLNDGKNILITPELACILLASHSKAAKEVEKQNEPEVIPEPKVQEDKHPIYKVKIGEKVTYLQKDGSKVKEVVWDKVMKPFVGIPEENYFKFQVLHSKGNDSNFLVKLADNEYITMLGDGDWFGVDIIDKESAKGLITNIFKSESYISHRFIKKIKGLLDTNALVIHLSNSGTRVYTFEDNIMNELDLSFE